MAKIGRSRKDTSECRINVEKVIIAQKRIEKESINLISRNASKNYFLLCRMFCVGLFIREELLLERDYLSEKKNFFLSTKTKSAVFKFSNFVKKMLA